MSIDQPTIRNKNQAPKSEYQRRLDLLRTAAALRDCLHRAIGNARLILCATAAITAWFAFSPQVVSAWWLALPLASFLVLAIIHGRVLSERRRIDRATIFYQRGISRLDGNWAGAGEQGLRFVETSHPYAEDLDIFGKGSLFELLCAARTRSGEDCLASWLKGASDIPEIRARQTAVDELREMLDLREDLAVLGSDMRAGVDPDALSRWATAPSLPFPGAVPLVAAILSLAAMAALVLWIILGTKTWFIAAAALELIFALRLRERVRRIVSGVEQPGRDLKLLSQVLARFERERFAAPRLVELRRTLENHGLPPARQIARLHRLIALLDSRRNQLFAPIAALLLWDVQLACAIEAWRRNSGPLVPRWLTAIGELEALCSIAGHAYEHPEDPFPELIATSPCFEGDRIGHPLLGEDRCVRNDVQLNNQLKVLVVSGSNMSGKSTFLRTIGTNAALALAGAPVRARRLRLSVLTLGASIRIMDSLHSGSSRFYAEITRLRILTDLTKGQRPLLFLLDELLHGTNSHDRRIGGEAVVRGLVERGAMGLLTTHDLALAHIADALAPRAANVHFEDHIENGKITFDYKLKPGIVQKSNALELMRSVGLDV